MFTTIAIIVLSVLLVFLAAAGALSIFDRLVERSWSSDRSL